MAMPACTDGTVRT